MNCESQASLIIYNSFIISTFVVIIHTTLIMAIAMKFSNPLWFFYSILILIIILVINGPGEVEGAANECNNHWDCQKKIAMCKDDKAKPFISCMPSGDGAKACTCDDVKYCNPRNGCTGDFQKLKCGQGQIGRCESDKCICFQKETTCTKEECDALNKPWVDKCEAEKAKGGSTPSFCSDTSVKVHTKCYDACVATKKCYNDPKTGGKRYVTDCGK